MDLQAEGQFGIFMSKVFFNLAASEMARIKKMKTVDVTEPSAMAMQRLASFRALRNNTEGNGLNETQPCVLAISYERTFAAQHCAKSEKLMGMHLIPPVMFGHAQIH